MKSIADLYVENIRLRQAMKVDMAILEEYCNTEKLVRKFIIKIVKKLILIYINKFRMFLLADKWIRLRIWNRLFNL